MNNDKALKLISFILFFAGVGVYFYYYAEHVMMSVSLTQSEIELMNVRGC